MTGGIEDFIALTTTSPKSYYEDLMNRADDNFWTLTEDDLLVLGALRTEHYASTPTTNHQLPTTVTEGSSNAT